MFTPNLKYFYATPVRLPKEFFPPEIHMILIWEKQIRTSTSKNYEHYGPTDLHI